MLFRFIILPPRHPQYDENFLNRSKMTSRKHLVAGERKAFLVLLVLFLVNAQQLAMVAEAGTLPTEYGFVNSGDTSIEFHDSYTGTLPTEIGLMTLASRIVTYDDFFFDDDGFSGPLPTELGQVTAMTYINLNDNQFTGDLSKLCW